MSYEPKIPPRVENQDLKKIVTFLQQELDSVSQELGNTDALELRVRNAAPDKPRNGMLVEADGTNWNPGAGAGLYVFRAGAWVRIG